MEIFICCLRVLIILSLELTAYFTATIRDKMAEHLLAYALSFRKRGGLEESLQRPLSFLVGEQEAPGPYRPSQERHPLLQMCVRTHRVNLAGGRCFVRRSFC